MASSSDAELPAGGAAAAVPVVVPEVLSPEVAAWNRRAAEALRYNSKMVRNAELIRLWSQQRDAMKVIKANLSRKLKNARSRYTYCKRKAHSLNGADLVESLQTWSDATDVSTDSEPTAAGADDAQFG